MTEQRCKHDVHGRDCFECFPSKVTFTDEDLAVLKKDLNKTHTDYLCRYLTFDEIKALLSRLEAAEKVAIRKNHFLSDEHLRDIEAWRLVSGK